MTALRTLTTLAALLAPALGESVTAHAADEARASVYQRARRSTVELLVDDRHRGCAWFATPEGLVLTAAHAVEGAPKRIELFSTARGRIRARLVAVDLGHDLALLQADRGEEKFTPLAVAQRTPPAGSRVYLFGAPLFRREVMLPGDVARDEAAFEYLPDQRRYVRCVHVAALAPPGTSGGAWLDAQGRVVALQSATMSLGPAPQGVAFAVPADAIRALLKARRNARTPTLSAAVEETWQQKPELLERLPPGTDGLVLRRLEEGGAAQRAGLKPDDVVIAVDGQTVRVTDELLRIVRSKRPGQTVRLRVLTPGVKASRTVEALLGQLEPDGRREKPR